MSEPAAMAVGATTLNDVYNNRLLSIGASHAPFVEQLARTRQEQGLVLEVVLK